MPLIPSKTPGSIKRALTVTILKGNLIPASLDLVAEMITRGKIDFKGKTRPFFLERSYFDYQVM